MERISLLVFSGSLDPTKPNRPTKKKHNRKSNWNLNVRIFLCFLFGFLVKQTLQITAKTMENNGFHVAFFFLNGVSVIVTHEPKLYGSTKSAFECFFHVDFWHRFKGRKYLMFIFFWPRLISKWIAFFGDGRIMKHYVVIYMWTFLSFDFRLRL